MIFKRANTVLLLCEGGNATAVRREQSTPGWSVSRRRLALSWALEEGERKDTGVPKGTETTGVSRQVVCVGK